MILRLVLGTLYVAMAVGQLVSWSRMPEILDAYQLPGTGSRCSWRCWSRPSWPAGCGW